MQKCQDYFPITVNLLGFKKPAQSPRVKGAVRNIDVTDVRNSDPLRQVFCLQCLPPESPKHGRLIGSGNSCPCLQPIEAFFFLHHVQIGSLRCFNPSRCFAGRLSGSPFLLALGKIKIHII